MMWSYDLSQLDRRLRDAGQSGRPMHYQLLRHFSGLVQPLTCSFESDMQPQPHEEAGADPSHQVEVPPRLLESKATLRCGD